MKKELRLLVVDGESVYSEFLKEFSDIWNERFSLVLSHVESATEAIAQLGELRPNVILVDAHLDDVNSLDFVEQCAGGSATLVVTSEIHSSTIESSAIERGACAYIPKTEDPDEVEFILERLAAICDASVEYH